MFSLLNRVMCYVWALGPELCHPTAECCRLLADIGNAATTGSSWPEYQAAKSLRLASTSSSRWNNTRTPNSTAVRCVLGDLRSATGLCCRCTISFPVAEEARTARRMSSCCAPITMRWLRRCSRPVEDEIIWDRGTGRHFFKHCATPSDIFPRRSRIFSVNCLRRSAQVPKEA